MINLSLQLPDWFLYVATAYFATRAAFTVVGIYLRRQAAKKVKNISPNNRRFR